MARPYIFVLPLLCVVCLAAVAEEQKKAAPARPDAPGKPDVKPAQVQAKQAQIQQVQVAVQIGGFGTPFGTPVADRESVEPTDDTERFLLLAPRGPIVVEAKIALDGQPFRVSREKLVDEMLAAADSNGDGKPTWKEGVDNPKFIFGSANFQIVIPVPAPIQNNNQEQPNKQPSEAKADAKAAADDAAKNGDQGDKVEEKEKGQEKDQDKDKKKDELNNVPPPQVQVRVFQLGNQNQDQQDEMIKYLDTNQNGLVDRAEARSMLARTSGGPTFSVVGAINRSREPDVKSILDKNNDGRLSKEELALASESLQSRDANGNDLLERSELGGTGVVRNVGAGQVIIVQAFNTVQNPLAVGHLLGPTANYAAIVDALKKKYGGQDGILRAESFSLFPEMFAQLDADANGQLEPAEVANLEQTKPHIQLEANIGSGGKDNTGGVRVRSIAKQLDNEDAISDEWRTEVACPLADVTLRFATAVSPTRRIDYSQTSQRMVERYDTNKDGHIEAKEIEKVNIGLVQQFKRWDTNSDGKVYAQEITESYRRQQAPMLSRVTAQLGEVGPSLFSILDQSGDQRLSLREMKTAARQLLSKDTTGDGEIGPDEMPGEIHVSIGQGVTYSSNVVFARAGQRPGANPKPKQEKGPAWFTRMDRNGDADVTLREFLGSEEQFQKIDTNGDGFIELSEALAAEIPGLKSGG